MRKITPTLIPGIALLILCLGALPQTVSAVDVQEVTTLTMSIDIKPGGCENPLNLRSKGVLPVAILGTSDFDVTTLDPTSFRLVIKPDDTDGAAPIRSAVEDVASPPAEVPTCEQTTCSDTGTGPDGFPDLTLKFRTQDVVGLLEDVSDGDCVVLYLKDIVGNALIGQDVLLILKKGPASPNPPGHNPDSPGANPNPNPPGHNPDPPGANPNPNPPGHNPDPPGSNPHNPSPKGPKH